MEGIKIGNLVHIDMNAARAQIHEFAQQQQRFTAIGERAGHWPDAHQPFLCDSLAGYLAAVGLIQRTEKAVKIEVQSCNFRKRQFRQSRRSEEHTSELQSLMRISYAVFCLK